MLLTVHMWIQLTVIQCCNYYGYFCVPIPNPSSFSYVSWLAAVLRSLSLDCVQSYILLCSPSICLTISFHTNFFWLLCSKFDAMTMVACIYFYIVHLRKRRTDRGRLKAPSTSAITYWSIEKQKEPLSGELGQDPFCRQWCQHTHMTVTPIWQSRQPVVFLNYYIPSVALE